MLRLSRELLTVGAGTELQRFELPVDLGLWRIESMADKVAEPGDPVIQMETGHTVVMAALPLLAVVAVVRDRERDNQDQVRDLVAMAAEPTAKPADYPHNARTTTKATATAPT